MLALLHQVRAQCVGLFTFELTSKSLDCIGVIWQLYNTDEPSSLCYLKSSVGVLNNGTDGAQPFCVFAGKDDEEYFTVVSSIDASTQTDTASTPLSTSTQTVYSEAPTPPASLTTSTVYVEASTPTSTSVVSGSTPIASSVSVSYVQAATPGTTTTSTAYAQSTACAVNVRAYHFQLILIFAAVLTFPLTECCPRDHLSLWPAIGDCDCGHPGEAHGMSETFLQRERRLTHQSSDRQAPWWRKTGDGRLRLGGDVHLLRPLPLSSRREESQAAVLITGCMDSATESQ